MKKLKLIMLFCIGTSFIVSKSFGQANPFINVLPSNSGIVSVGATIDILVTIGNTGPVSTIQQAKLRPIIQVPPSVTFLPNAQQVGLPAGWTILSNTGSQLRLCNSTDPIPVSTSRTIILKAQGVAVTSPQTFSGNINFGNGTTCSAGTSVAGDLITDNSATSTLQVVAPPVTTLNLKAFIQGYYLGGGFMNPTLSLQGLPNPVTHCDSLTVELHHSTSPYALAFSFKGVLLTNGEMACTYPGAAVGNYYIVLKHRNALETWSASPFNFVSGINSYDFTTAATKALGDNQTDVASEGIYSIYNGDINLDLSTDASDFLIMDYDIQNFNSGYISTDLNGDGTTDASDFLILDGNIQSFVGAIVLP